MKKTAYLLIALALLMAAPAFAQDASKPFTDVPQGHWAYDAINQLQAAGLIIGYPDGTFGGKRALTRYEFAVALARLYSTLEAEIKGIKPGGPTGPTGPTLTQEQVQGMINNALANYATKADLDQLRKLIDEFRDELATLGVDVDALKRDVQALCARVEALEAEVRRVRFTGDVNVFAIAGATNGGRTTAIDLDERRLAETSLGRNIGVVKDADLTITGRVSNSTTAVSTINYGNYLNYLEFVDDYVDGRRPINKNFIAGQGGSLTDGFFPYYLYINSALGKGVFQAGRLPLQFTPYTLKKIDVDSYTNILKTDDGNYPMDGAKLGYNFGVVDLTLFAAKNDTNQYLLNGLTGQPTAGLYRNLTGRAGLPFHSVGGHSVGGLQDLISQTAGVRAVAGIPWRGVLGATYYRSWSRDAWARGANYDQAQVYGADLNLPLGPVGLAASWTRSDTLARSGSGAGDVNTANIAADGKLTAGFGKLAAGVGYKYIRHNFAAAGYWDKIGRWTNPTNVRGPYAELALPILDNLKLTLNGEWLQMISTMTTNPGVWGFKDDVVAKAVGAIQYGFTKRLSLDASYQWIKYNPDLFTGVARTEATETYLTTGLAYQMNANTGIKVGYQFINYNNGTNGTGPYGPDYRGGEGVVQVGVSF